MAKNILVLNSNVIMGAIVFGTIRAQINWVGCVVLGSWKQLMFSVTTEQHILYSCHLIMSSEVNKKQT